jgi:NitT/TauT family transport system substrate-binding protein
VFLVLATGGRSSIMIVQRRFNGIRRLLSLLLLLTLLAVPSWAARSGSAGAAGMTKVRMAFSTWTGYGPLVVAAQNGFFRKYGLDVSYSIVEAPAAREAAIRAGQLDGAATTIDTFTRWSAQGASLQIVFGIDRSEGGDGIVAKKSITSVKQLKGKTVAVSTGTVSEFFFDYVLRQNGMSISDVNLKDMPDSSVSGSTFVAGRVDAAVTWEPWLSRAAKTSFGHILVSSAVYPNIIVDAFAFSSSFVKAHPAAVRNFVKAYFEAVNFTRTNKSGAYKVIGKYVSETPAGVASDLSKVPLMDLAASKAYFGSGGNGPIYVTARGAANFWLRLKKISKMPNFSQLINSSFM